MFLFTSTMYYLVVKVYDLLKVDFLFLEALKNAEFVEKKTKFIKVLSRLNRRGKGVIALVLIFFSDPFIVAIYMRKGSRRWDGIPDKKTLICFLVSALFSNLLWVSGWDYVFSFLN